MEDPTFLSPEMIQQTTSKSTEPEGEKDKGSDSFPDILARMPGDLGISAESTEPAIIEDDDPVITQTEEEGRRTTSILTCVA